MTNAIVRKNRSRKLPTSGKFTIGILVIGMCVYLISLLIEAQSNKLPTLSPVGSDLEFKFVPPNSAEREEYNSFNNLYSNIQLMATKTPATRIQNLIRERAFIGDRDAINILLEVEAGESRASSGSSEVLLMAEFHDVTDSIHYAKLKQGF